MRPESEEGPTSKQEDVGAAPTDATTAEPTSRPDDDDEDDLRWVREIIVAEVCVN